MGILLNPVLGTPKGKAGQLVYRNVKGRTIFSTLPLKTESIASPDTLERRSRFKLLNPLFSCMMQDFYIRSIWEKSKVPSNSPRNKMMKVNNILFGQERDLHNIVLIPGEKVFVPVLTSAVYDEGTLVFSLEPLSFSLILNTHHYEISLHGVIQFSEPRSGITSPFRFSPFASETIKFLNNVPLVFTVPLLQQEKFLFNDYTVRKFISAAIITTNLKEPKTWSAKMCGEL